MSPVSPSPQSLQSIVCLQSPPAPLLLQIDSSTTLMHKYIYLSSPNGGADDGEVIPGEVILKGDIVPADSCGDDITSS